MGHIAPTQPRNALPINQKGDARSISDAHELERALPDTSASTKSAGEQILSTNAASAS